MRSLSAKLLVDNGRLDSMSQSAFRWKDCRHWTVRKARQETTARVIGSIWIQGEEKGVGQEERDNGGIGDVILSNALTCPLCHSFYSYDH